MPVVEVEAPKVTVITAPATSSDFLTETVTPIVAEPTPVPAPAEDEPMIETVAPVVETANK